jgi:hypothetical protein
VHEPHRLALEILQLHALRQVLAFVIEPISNSVRASGARSSSAAMRPNPSTRATPSCHVPTTQPIRTSASSSGWTTSPTLVAISSLGSGMATSSAAAMASAKRQTAGALPETTMLALFVTRRTER